MQSSFLRRLFATVIGNTLIAVFLTALGVGDGWAVNLLISQSIGFSIFGSCSVAAWMVGEGPRRLPAMVAAFPVGVVGGILLGTRLAGVGLNDWPLMAWQAVTIGTTLGFMGSGFFYLRERNQALVAEVRERELARLEAEKRGIEAQLRMLQAQIEPHFLFNSLANVSGLIPRDPALAGTLLDALIRYLRASLVRTRAPDGTLADEVALLRAYLDILKIRMGERLHFAFDVTPELLAVPFPPMLLQPLVENAITHGLECKIEGGTVSVVARSEGAQLIITISDDGLGIDDSPSPSSRRGEGIGLSNIRARLAALFGSAGHLSLASKVGAGTTATIVMPRLEIA